MPAVRPMMSQLDTASADELAETRLERGEGWWWGLQRGREGGRERKREMEREREEKDAAEREEKHEQLESQFRSHLPACACALSL